MDDAIREAIDKIAVQSGQRAAARLIRLRATCGEPLTVEEIDAAELTEREAVRQRLPERVQAGSTIANTPDDRHAWSTLLAAESEREVDAAFDQIFDLVDQARQTGDISECERLVNWLVREEVIAELHVDILLSSLRLTATIRHEIQGWAAAVQAVADELSKRGTEVAEVDALLWGLRK